MKRGLMTLLIALALLGALAVPAMAEGRPVPPHEVMGMGAGRPTR